MASLKKLTVSARLMLLILVAALPVFILYVWQALDQRQGMLDSAEDQLIRSARLMAAQQNQFFLRAHSVLSTMLIAAENIGPSEPACNGLLSTIASRDSTYLVLSVATPDGTIICSSAPEAVGLNLADRAYFSAAVGGGGFAVGAPQVGAVTGRPIIPLVEATRGGGSDIAYIGIASLDVDALSETMALSRLPAGGVGVIFNAERAILARNPAGITIDEAILAPVRPEVATTSGGAGLVQGDPVNGNTNLWAVADLLPEQGLYVAVGVPVAEIIAGADRDLFRGIAILLVVFAIAGASAWFIGQGTIRRPLERLATAVSSLRRGDLSARFDAGNAAPELQALAQGFNAMAGSIEENDAELQQRNARLNQLIDDKEMLLREMNHRVKNSLQLVSSLVGLQLGNVTDPAARTGLANAQARVAAVAKVHERLYVGARLDRVDVAPYIQELCRDLSQTLGLEERGGAITVAVVDSDLPPDRVIPLGLITCELVTNAAKHGGEGSVGAIAVTLIRDGEDLQLSVSDEGPGVPADFEAAAHSGLGMKVIRALANQLGGKLEIERLPVGSRFSVRFAVGEMEAV